MSEPAFAERPPFANRGVETVETRTNRGFVGRPSGVGVDWLSMTLAAEVAAELVIQTELVEVGKGKEGFRQAERRAMMGGEAWRRFEPVTASRRWGLAYESWEWDGPSAGWPAEWCRGRDCRPSRVDVAFDFSVPDGVSADDVFESMREEVQRRELLVGISGQGGVNTRYIGGKESERRIRIYRKDLEDEAWALQFGPTVRIELILRGDVAEDWWDGWSISREGALREAAGHVFEMTGCEVLADWEVPTGLQRVRESFEVAAAFKWVIRQYGAVLDVAFECGVDLVSLVAERAAKSGRAGRWRRDRLRRAVEAVGVEQLEQAIRSLLALD